MSIFVDDTLLEGEVFYIIVSTKSGKDRPLPIVSDEGMERYKERLKSFKVYFRPQNYKSFNDMMRDGVIIQPDGNVLLHPTTMREAQLKHLLVKWSLTDDAGDEVPLTPESLDNLYPNIANAIMDEYTKLSAAELDATEEAISDMHSSQPLDMEEIESQIDSIESKSSQEE